MRIIIFLLLTGLLTGCAGLETKELEKGPLYNYKADMTIRVDGINYDGVGITQLDGPKNIKLKSQAKLDVLVISSCHRYDKFEKVDSSWFSGSSKEFKYDYIPAPIEKESGCPIYLQAFDKKGIVSWGYLQFNTDQVLNGTLECSGKVKNWVGTSICQVKAGLDQAISFKKKIKAFSADKNCNMKRVDDFKFTFRPSLGFCIAEFSDGQSFHSHTTLAFDEIFIRGEN